MKKQSTRSFDHPVVEVLIAASPADVWRALRDPALIHQWFGWDADGLAAEIQEIFVDGGEPDDATRVLAFTGVADRYEVAAGEGGTTVRLVRSAPSADADSDDVYEETAQGWIAFTQQLKFALERHPGQTRRTLYFSGGPSKPGGALAMTALGIAHLTDVGSRYALTTPFGEELTGAIWHRGRHQLGLQVAGWGDGLLVIVDRPANPRWPRGRSQATLTTYGLSERAFEALRQRWTAFWPQHFEAPAAPA